MQSEDHHPPPTCKEEVLWRGACGQSMSELLAKAIYNGEALLYKEARLRPDICDCLTSLLLQQKWRRNGVPYAKMPLLQSSIDIYCTLYCDLRTNTKMITGPQSRTTVPRPD
ncbi:hypothetical protein V6Z90_001912 [Aspergillus fumigatus]